MKVFQELQVVFDRNRGEEFISGLEQRLTNGWSRYLEGERKHGISSLSRLYYFVCDKTKTRPAALLAFAGRDDQTLYVSNVVPREKGQLSHDEYNAILTEFHRAFVVPLAEAMGAKVSLKKGLQSLEDWVSPASVAAFRRFSDLANKSTGTSHPSDQARWFDFVISIVLNDDPLDASTLMRWLVEDDGWDDEHAQRMAIEFEQETGLLRHFRSH